MKKFGFILFLTLLVLISSACSGGDAKKDQTADTPKKETATAPSEEKQTEQAEPFSGQVSVQAGLGDSVDAFKQQYGENKGNEQMGKFNGEYLLPMFINGRAVDMTVQFEATEQKTRSLEEAKQIAAQMIPKDATLEKEFTDDPALPKKVLLYHSETLAKLFPEWEPAGKFLVIFGYQAGKENEVSTITIGMGDTP